jgi:hypothetical protein
MKSLPNGAATEATMRKAALDSGRLAFYSDVGAASTGATYSIVTGSKPLHLAIRAVASLVATLVLNEGTTLTPANAFTPTFYNRVTPQKDFGATFGKTPTGVSGGVNLGTQNIPAGLPAQHQSSVSDDVEFILKQNTTYLLTLAMASGTWNLDFEMYEEF